MIEVMKMYPNLFSPIKIGNLTLKNRIIAAPTCVPYLTLEGYLTRDLIAYFEWKAAGGAAVVTIGESIVHTKTGQSHMLQIPLDDERVLPSLANAAKAIRRHGAIPSIQLSHGGKHGGINRLSRNRNERLVRYGPSYEIAQDGTEIFEMPEELILEIVQSYGDAATFVKRSGFEMLMIHAGHGWLLSQFLSPLENKRTDKYGGNFENRARLPLMVIDRIRKSIGPNFPIEFRMNGDDFIEDGFTQEDGIKLARLIENKVDLIQVSAGNYAPMELFVRTHPTMFLEHGCNIYLAATIKKAVKTPVACVGGITNPVQMEEVIATGKADIVELARALIADPYLPKRAKAGKNEEIIPCLRCHVCMGESAVTNTFKCAVNPLAGNEFESKFLLQPAEKSKGVLIAGGGPAGMQAAITATARGHQVILCERTASLGGALRYAEHIAFKDDLTKFRKYLEHGLQISGVRLYLNTVVTPEFVANQSPDVLIAAVGAIPLVPQIPGIDNKKVISANYMYSDDVVIGDRVVIIGGGLVGCEESIHLARLGKVVTVIELLNEVARDANIFLRTAIMAELRKNVNVMTGTECKAIIEEGILCVDSRGNEKLFEADTIIYAVGQRSLTSMVDQLRDTAPEFYCIGDCVRPQKIAEAISSGYHIAVDL